MYHEHAFGQRRQLWDELVPHTAAEAVALLDHGHDLLTGSLASLQEPDLDQPRMTNWGELWPTWRIFWTMVSHDVQHGSEIACLRDLYAHRVSRGATQPV